MHIPFLCPALSVSFFTFSFFILPFCKDIEKWGLINALTERQDGRIESKNEWVVAHLYLIN